MLKEFIVCVYLSCNKLQKKKKKQLKSAKAVPEPTVNDATHQLPAVRRSDDPVVPQVFPSCFCTYEKMLIF